jgi:hypothetical protein
MAAAFVEFQDDQQHPFLGEVSYSLVDRAGIIHGILLETPDYL